MEADQQKIEALRTELHRIMARKHEVSEALLDTGRDKDEVKALLDEGADLSLKIESLENQIRALEFPEIKEAEAVNPWENPLRVD